MNSAPDEDKHGCWEKGLESGREPESLRGWVRAAHFPALVARTAVPWGRGSSSRNQDCRSGILGNSQPDLESGSKHRKFP